MCPGLTSPIPIVPQVLSLRLDTRLADLEVAIINTGGDMEQVLARLKDLEDRQSGKSVTMGGYSFKDARAVHAEGVASLLVNLQARHLALTTPVGIIPKRDGTIHGAATMIPSSLNSQTTMNPRTKQVWMTSADRTTPPSLSQP